MKKYNYIARQTRRWYAGILAFVSLCISCGSTSTQPQHAKVQPLPADVQMAPLMDSDFPASLTAQDIDFQHQTVTFTIYSKVRYKAQEVQALQLGDTLLYNKDTLVVASLTQEYGGLTVNGGLEEGGAWLMPDEDSTYRAAQFDDHSLYDEVEQVTLPMAAFFTLVDCGENPTDPSKVITAQHEQYLQSLPDYRQQFSVLETRVLVKNGQVSHIIRKWIP